MTRQQENTTLGKYRLLEQLGRGGYGTVYLAIDTVLEVERAVKVLHPQLAADPHFIERFQKEAKTAAKLDHPNIVRVYDLDEVGGRYFLVMEYMPGGSLKDRISQEGHLSLEDALRITEQIASALQYASALDLVHLDIKPGNILFDQDGIANLSDFGFSKALSGSSSATLSLTGGVIATPAYMAPEVWENEPAGPFTDEYSLACVFYESITGKVLFNGDSSPVVIMRKHFKPLVLPEEWPEGVPDEIGGVFETALAKDPQERFQDGLEMIQAVKELVRLEDLQETINQEEAKFRHALAGRNWAQAAIIISKIENYGETGKEKAVELRDELAQTQQQHHVYLEKVAGVQAEGIQAVSHGDLALAETKITLLQSMGPEGLADAEKLQKQVSSARRSAERSRKWAETKSRIQPYLKRVAIAAGALIALMVVVVLWQRLNITECIAGLIQRESHIIPTVVESQVHEVETQAVKPAAYNAEATTPVQPTPTQIILKGVIIGVEGLDCFQEPDPEGQILDRFEVHDLVSIYGRNADSSWVLVRAPKREGNCWVLKESVIIGDDVNLSLEIPPEKASQIDYIWISSVDGMEMANVPTGKFSMGSAHNFQTAKANEKPQHNVLVDAFWIDKTEVTNAMFASFLNNNPLTEGQINHWMATGDPRYYDALIIKKDGEWQPIKGFENYPAIEITWSGAKAYCEWNERRLPTEAEWEKAARGTHAHLYPWGDLISCERVSHKRCGENLAPVGSIPNGSSPYGALDMAGNVWEWVADWYDDQYYKNSPYDNPEGPPSGENKVLRGGSWLSESNELRSNFRKYDKPNTTKNQYGFRCAISVNDEQSNQIQKVQEKEIPSIQETSSSLESTLDDTISFELTGFVEKYVEDFNIKHIDDFNETQITRWRVQSPPVQTTNGLLQILGSDNNWARVYSNKEYKSGEGVIIVYKFEPSAYSELFFFNSSYGTSDYFRFGIGHQQARTRTTSYERGKSDYDHWVAIGGNLHANTWYKMLLAIGNNSEILMVVEPLDDPKFQYNYKKEFSDEVENLKWTLEMQSTESTLFIDKVIDITFSKLN